MALIRTGRSPAAPFTQLSEEQLLQIKENIFRVLEELTYRFTEGRSNSIKNEDAQAIVKSIIMAAELSGEADISDYKRFKAAYQDGLKALDEKIAAAADLYEQVKQTAVKTALKAYREMIDTGIAQFFLRYDRTFAAAEVPADIDYFLIENDNRLDGVFFMENFLSGLLIENKVCGAFRPEDIEAVLQEFGNRERQVYTMLHPNLFELVFVNGIFAVLLEEMPTQICLREEHRALLESRLAAMPNEARRTLLEEASAETIRALGFAEAPEIAAYMKDYVRRHLLPRVASADTVESILNIPLFCTAAPSAQAWLAYGKKMPDAAFRAVLAEIQAAERMPKKMQIMRAHIHSLVDYIDLFKAEAFAADEYAAVFDALEDEELAVLARFVLQDYRELSGGRAVLQDAKSAVLWEQRLIDYLKSSGRGIEL